jgi:putative transposase
VHAQLRLVRNDHVTDTRPVRARYPDFAALIATSEDEGLSNALRRAESIGQPLGDAAFLDRLEHLTGRSLRPAKRGPKPHEHK